MPSGDGLSTLAKSRRHWLLVLGFLALALGWQTWAQWGAIRVDCGREVYVPLVLLDGGSLYADAWYPYGPLPPYLQAAVLALFGVHLEALYGLGLALTLAFAWLLFDLGTRLVEPAAGGLVAFGFLLYAFMPELFNFVFPYTFAATLGAVLGLLGLRLLVAYTDTGRARFLVWTGIVSSLSLLTKQEFGVASVLLAVLILALPGRRSRCGDLVAELARYLPALLLAFLVYGYYFAKLTPEFVLLENFQTHPSSVFFRTFGKKWVVDRGLRFNPRELAANIGLGAAALGTWWLLGRVGEGMARRPARRLGVLAVLAAAVLAFFTLAPDGWPASGLSLLSAVLFPAGMFWFTVAVLVQQGARVLRWRTTVAPDIALVAAALYGLLTGVRILARVVPYGYGLYYSFPLFLLFIYWVFKVLRAGTTPHSEGPALAVLVMALGLIGVAESRMLPLARNKAPFDSPIGRIHAAREDLSALTEVVAFLETRPRASREVLIAPDEVFLYAFAGLRAPSRWYQLTPGILDVRDEERLIQAAEAKGVRYVLVSNRYAGEYGVRFFGIDYSRTLQSWIDARFEPVRDFGQFQRLGRSAEQPGAPMGLRLYARRTTAPLVARADRE